MVLQLVTVPTSEKFMSYMILHRMHYNGTLDSWEQKIFDQITENNEWKLQLGTVFCNTV